MGRALFHAARGAGRTAPNPMVGAVVVDGEGVIVGQGWHERAGEAHAEVHALAAAGERARGATLYVTLEPCCHTGRTGPCTDRIIEAGIARVVAAMADPNPLVAGKGFERLRRHGVAVDVDVRRDEALRLNAAFVTRMTLGRPRVLLKAATSLDGCVAAGRGERTSISSRDAHRRSHVLRAAIDAIAVGSETMLVDDPLLTARECCRARPLTRVIFDRRLRTPEDARIFSTRAEGPIVIATAPLDARTAAQARELQAAGAAIIEADDLGEVMRLLAARDILTLLVEGGPTLQDAFAREGLVDQVHLIVAPQTLGAAGVRWLDAATLPVGGGAFVRAETRGVDTWIEADVYRNR